MSVERADGFGQGLSPDGLHDGSVAWVRVEGLVSSSPPVWPVGSLGTATSAQSKGSLGLLLSTVAVTPLCLCSLLSVAGISLASQLRWTLFHPQTGGAYARGCFVLWEWWGLGWGSASWSISCLRPCMISGVCLYIKC